MKKIILIILLTLIAGCSSDNNLINENGLTGNLEPTSGVNYAENCLSIQDSMFMQMCAAVANKNIMMCNDVKNSDENEQKYHQSMCRQWVAAASNDIKLCDSFKEGDEFLISEFGCYELMAVASKDISICEKISTENGKKGCKTSVEMASSDINKCSNTGCIYNYALRTKDKSACDKFKEVTTAYVEMHEASCNAMITGDVSLCNPIKSIGVDNWNFCKIKANYGKMIPGGSVFDFSLCKKDDECIKTVMHEMIFSMVR